MLFSMYLRSTGKYHYRYWSFLVVGDESVKFAGGEVGNLEIYVADCRHESVANRHNLTAEDIGDLLAAGEYTLIPEEGWYISKWESETYGVRTPKHLKPEILKAITTILGHGPLRT